MNQGRWQQPLREFARNSLGSYLILYLGNQSSWGLRLGCVFPTSFSGMGSPVEASEAVFKHNCAKQERTEFWWGRWPRRNREFCIAWRASSPQAGPFSTLAWHISVTDSTCEVWRFSQVGGKKKKKKKTNKQTKMCLRVLQKNRGRVRDRYVKWRWIGKTCLRFLVLMSTLLDAAPGNTGAVRLLGGLQGYRQLVSACQRSEQKQLYKFPTPILSLVSDVTLCQSPTINEHRFPSSVKGE